VLTLPVAATAVLAGLLIGVTGVGGVLLVPALTELASVPVERAVAASMMAFLLGGTVAAFAHARHADVSRNLVLPLCISAAAGAALGAASLTILGPDVVRLVISVTAFSSGLQALVAPRTVSGERIPSANGLGVLGVLVGYGSAISGTGGPALLVPLLLLFRAPVRVAIFLALAVQVPISLSATAVNLVSGRIDYALAAALSVLVLAGTMAGSFISRAISRRVVTVAVAIILVLVGGWYGASSISRLL